MCDRDDRELVTRLQDCDQTAFAALVDRRAAALRRTALSFASTRASADEVVQDTWLPGREVCVRLAPFRCRRRMIRSRPRSDDTRRHLLLRKGLAGALVDAIRDLPERQRAGVVLGDALGCSGSEVCDVLGVTEGNQRILLHRARARLRAILTPYEDANRDVELPYHRTNDRLARRRAHAG